MAELFHDKEIIRFVCPVLKPDKILIGKIMTAETSCEEMDEKKQNTN